MSKNQIPNNSYTDNTSDLENKNEFLNFIAESADEGIRIDVFLSERTEKTRAFIQRLFDENLISVNGKTKKKNYKVQNGDKISVTIPMPEKTDILPEDIPLKIVYEDEHLLVVDKPKGMVVHPAPGNYSGTLVNALMHHCGDSLSGINGYIRPGIVHRIDKDTSGLLIVAKTDEAHQGLAEQISVHSFTRMYEAVVVGNLKENQFTVDLPIGRHPVDRKKMAVVYENSKNAKTDVVVLKRYNGYTHVRLFLHTGRTHQIRVHMSHMGHPVLGDTVYGNKSKTFPRLEGQCLLAKYISFVHPISKETISFTAEMPDYFKDVIEKLEKIQ
ncbi:MAG: RluA family pseudouridine synthase [Ruminococcaceae bacterium]|nr:RluA family pseudouridine synthase [Oscillospiraceae bacterium]